MSATAGGITPEFRAYVAALRAMQGLPPTVEDPATLERVAAVFRLVPPPIAPVAPVRASRAKVGAPR